MRGIVRARVDATWLRMLGAKIAGGRFFLDNGLLVPRMFVIIGLRAERMHIDISVGAILGAQTAADAPVFDDDFQ